jgi:hypothetical protein
MINTSQFLPDFSNNGEPEVASFHQTAIEIAAYRSLVEDHMKKANDQIKDIRKEVQNFNFGKCINILR